MHHICNFRTISGSHLQFSVNNRALQYGDGLFETIIVRNNTVCYIDDHYRRLMDGLEAFRMTLPATFTKKYLEQSIHELVKKNELGKNARVKLIAWRKWGGAYVPDSREAEFLLSTHPFQPPASITKSAGFYEDFRLGYSPVSAFKTLNSLPYIMAGIAMKERKHEDMILLGTHSRIVECIYSNIFWIKGKTVFTPSLESGCVNGVGRQQLLKKLEAEKITYEEGTYSKDDLLEADVVFTSNVTGIKVIKAVESTGFRTEHPVVDKLKRVFLT